MATWPKAIKRLAIPHEHGHLALTHNQLCADAKVSRPVFGDPVHKLIR